MKKYSYNLRFDKIIYKNLKSSFMDLPSPKKFSYFWKFGFSLVVFLGMQFGSGLLLAMCYVADVDIAFNCLDLIMRDMKYGWMVRLFHANGASFFFMSLYLHMSRGLYYFSFYYVKVWFTGLVMLILSMGTGFFGYVLPWGQMSYWAATVITNLLSVIPFVGTQLVQWLWGGFSVSSPTLTRFFCFHFLFPFVMVVVILAHFVFLHERGSNNPLGMTNHTDKVPFAPYYLEKDLFSQSVIMVFYMSVVFFVPHKIMNAVKFMESNPMVTPEHIEPEWYLLAPYTILRSIPSKLGGVMILVLFFVVLFSLPFYVNFNLRYFQYKNWLQILYFCWGVNYMFLTMCGAIPPEFPFLVLSQISCFFFFSYFCFLGLLSWYKYEL